MNSQWVSLPPLRKHLHHGSHKCHSSRLGSWPPRTLAVPSVVFIRFWRTSSDDVDVRCCGCGARCCASKSPSLVDDNCCRCNFAALRQLTGLHQLDIIYATYHVDVRTLTCRCVTSSGAVAAKPRDGCFCIWVFEIRWESEWFSIVLQIKCYTVWLCVSIWILCMFCDCIIAYIS